MRTLMLPLVPALLTLSGCAGWVVFGHTIGEHPAGAAAQPAAAAEPTYKTDHPYATSTPLLAPPQATAARAPLGVPMLKSVTVVFTAAARQKIDSEPQFDTDRLLAAIQDELRAHRLLDDSDPRASGTLEISIDDFATHPLSNAVVFGYSLGNGTLAGHLEVRTAGSDEPRDWRINAQSRVDKPVGAEPSNPFGPLYRKFAALTVDQLGGG
jgi:hypothetical protein